ncbi:dihydrodipicolinate synthase [Salsuginibacillus halophilus]|uniref:4-hydroxy-tetrahydrodipicolinate synthase n=2 Tax=Salsuginibacillus halophilus TaxID=517424 RepID=A0A2P8HYI8_9BACI|nr:dihydrodipicolinate synthase [Salsuginibacillus halophilus]
MVTPFQKNESLDLEAFKSLVDHLCATGSEGLVVGGTTGEAPVLTLEEKTAIAEAAVERTGGRVPVFAGAGTNATASSVQAVKQLTSTGVDGIMAVVPYYNKPNQRGLYQHFKKMAEATHLPLMIYNIPGRTSVNLAPETVVELAKVENITSVKEASGDLEQCAYIIENTPDDFHLYAGDDSATLPVMAIGGFGVVSVAAHVIGTEMHEMVHAFARGEVAKAAALHRELLDRMKMCFSAPNPAPVKALLHEEGLLENVLRLPLLPVDEKVNSALVQSFSRK